MVAAWLRDSSKDLISCRPTILLSPYRQYVVVHILPPLTACPEQPFSILQPLHDVALIFVLGQVHMYYVGTVHAQLLTAVIIIFS